MAKDTELSTDWERSAGDFTCIVCRRKRLPASEFSRKQVEKALESLKTIQDKDFRSGPELTSTYFVSGTCKKCMEEKEERERQEAQARRDQREEAAGEAVLEPPEHVPVKFAARPFGLTAVKGDGVEGYIVAKADAMEEDLQANFNKIAPFGKEDTARELQDHAAKTQDTLVDAVENAEVAEIKRAVFRSLTRLRAATIKEFDTVARLETQAIDAYNDAHHYRAENPLQHLHSGEAPVESDKLTSFH